MEDIKKAILDFAETSKKSKFYFKDLEKAVQETIPDAKSREIKKAATALINEVYLRLVDVQQASWQDRAHFFALCALAMRQILVDYARRRGSAKRGGGQVTIELEEGLGHGSTPEVKLLELDDALNRLATLDPRKSQVVELRFFGGLSVGETAEALKISPETVHRDWKFARAWLYGELGGNQRYG